jgi:ferredoxin
MTRPSPNDDNDDGYGCVVAAGSVLALAGPGPGPGATVLLAVLFAVARRRPLPAAALVEPLSFSCRGAGRGRCSLCALRLAPEGHNLVYPRELVQATIRADDDESDLFGFAKSEINFDIYLAIEWYFSRCPLLHH